MASTFAAQHLLSVREAQERIRPHLRRTPLLTTDLDPGLLLKPECFQLTGSFKVRGAFNAILSLGPSEGRGVITASSGNHAQAVAMAARLAGFKATILIPEGANPTKIAATRALGAEVITEGVTMSNRDERLAEAVERTGLTLVHPYDNWDVLHGQGTAALEILEDRPETATIATPVGGGGLLSGTAIAARATNPAIRVIGVEPEVANDAYRSFTSGVLTRLEKSPETMADGVRTMSIGSRNFEVLVENRLIDEIVTVTEAELQEALLTAWLRLKIALEPTGALPLAAYLAGKLPRGTATSPTALILSGGNFDPSLMATLLAS